ncbi:hypothetical protein LCGC14_0237460 [marine sediment metagenome]|jgi:hypothetical protein|uniref:MvaT DNA-binding domain-containing protein n=1 Tax=marine sediment metagenome TaxID=412755 RepID=A0A0F9UD74_9ZZZZ|nr:histone-like nucleoid-structuring protein, MvaT/MvaU family [Halopseudomonas aestusnigri]MCK5529909.1 H-NS histone family protein [Halopseudomonas aestusnigri]UGV30034.1 H-NS histone family protein [Halopseudomonas aestusnigri]|tara:strand:+ start:10907 stop:11254 length:348 start_codon:yes stop_codon:yes gene_type:complete
MSKLAAFRELEKQIAELEAKKEKLAKSEELTSELEFTDKLKALVAEYGYSPEQVISLLNPNAGTSSEGKTRRERTAKTYVNPHTGESVITKGGNNKTLKAWKAQYGEEAVKSWVQ